MKSDYLSGCQVFTVPAPERELPYVLEFLDQAGHKFIGAVRICIPDLKADSAVLYSVLKRESDGKMVLFARNDDKTYGYSNKYEVDLFYPYALEFWQRHFPEIEMPKLEECLLNSWALQIGREQK